MIGTLLLAVAAPAPRPKIDLALGGGGARGSAQVAVLRQLEAQHIPIDYIAGTSIGAVVGGLYALGMTPDELERALTTIDWRDALNDRTKYKDLAYRRQEDDNRYLTALEAGVQGGHITLPSGLRSGQRLRFLLQSYLIPVASTTDFSKLPVPFRAVATDIETGEPVVLDHGNLAQSIRASMSIPGVFSPVEIDGRVLVDGGVADNVPVDVVRAMGADVVITVDVGSPLVKRDQLGSCLAVTGQVLTILTRQNAQKQLAGADSRRDLGARDDYSKLSASASGVVSHGRQSFFLGASGGTNLGTRVPVYDQFSLGGLLNLSGFAYGQLHGERYALLRAGTYRLLRTLPEEIGSGVYAGVFAEFGNAWMEEDRDSAHVIHRSPTLIGGADTIIGPLLLGYSRTDTGEGRFSVTIGKTF